MTSKSPAFLVLPVFFPCRYQLCTFKVAWCVLSTSLNSKISLELRDRWKYQLTERTSTGFIHVCKPTSQHIPTMWWILFQDLQVYLIFKIKIPEVTIPDYWSFISENSMSFGICSNSFPINYHSLGSLWFPSQSSHQPAAQSVAMHVPWAPGLISLYPAP